VQNVTNTAEVAPATPSLTSCFRPITEYLRLLRGASRNLVSPAVALSPHDAWLLYQLAAFYPLAPTVIDLAAEATTGASVAFWAAHPGVRRVLALAGPPTSRPATDWRRLFPRAAAELKLAPDSWEIIETTLDQRDGRDAITRVIDPLAPPFFLLAATDTDAATVTDTLVTIRAIHADAVTLIIPLGLTGQSPLLDTVLRSCPADGPDRLTLLRECSPFCAASPLGVIARAENPFVFEAFERLHRLFDGNFQFIDLVERATAASLHEASAERKAEATVEAMAETARQQMAERDARIAELDAQVIERDARIAERDTRLMRYDARIAERDTRLMRYDARIAERDTRLIRRDARLAELLARAATLDAEIAKKNVYLVSIEDRARYIEEQMLPWKDAYIAELETHIRNQDASTALRLSRILGRVGRTVRRVI